MVTFCKGGFANHSHPVQPFIPITGHFYFIRPLLLNPSAISLVGTFRLQSLSASEANATLGKIHIAVSQLLPEKQKQANPIFEKHQLYQTSTPIINVDMHICTYARIYMFLNKYIIHIYNYISIRIFCTYMYICTSMYICTYMYICT
jgi:hypothetical protein